MKNNYLKLLTTITLILSIILIYCITVENNVIFESLVYLFFGICLILCIIYKKHLVTLLKKSSLDKYISLIGLEVALIVFIQSGIQGEKNNKQFQINRINSDSLFRTQLIHSENLNDSLIQELNKIQAINLKQNLASKNQLIATQNQLELSKITLDNYISETKANLILDLVKLSKIDTLNEKECKISITCLIQNIGKRIAHKIEVRQMILFDKKNKTELTINDNASFLEINTPKRFNYSPQIPIEKSEDFYFWCQVRYYDRKLNEYFDRSYYRHYYKSAGELGFYYSNDKEVTDLRLIIDKELISNGHSLTKN